MKTFLPMQVIRRMATAMLAAVLSLAVYSAEPFIVFQPEVNTLALHNAAITFDTNEHTCVRRAVENLCTDLERVTGKRPTILNGNVNGNTRTEEIVIGTVGVNQQITQWTKKGLLKELKGKTEKYIIKTIGNQLVIAGSDKRGTVYGIYELSQQVGVSPWYDWADVPITHRDALYVKQGEYTDGEPAVRYRGIFLNDEAPCLTSWVENTYGTKYGDHRFYERVFELILRLKGNFLWPAMWGWAFYADDPLNAKTADEMGIIVGTSHHEPMARNHQEWVRHRREYGAWNYQTNQAVLDKFFREGIERMKGSDDIVTIGMRGDGDEAMSDEADTQLLQRIVANQRKIITQVTGKPAKETPQVWALYKEVLDYYDKGMRVPDDVCILLCDDNWGNVRRVPQGKERKHPGGWGLYYHVDYVGAPRNTKWLNVTPTQNMWEQLTLAYENGIDRMWILNVGDLKPMEYPITLFMDMAWQPHIVGAKNITDHTEAFCRQQFGEEQGPEAARLLNICCKYAGRCTAEMLDKDTYNVETGEWRQVADDYMRLETEAMRQYLSLEENYRDAYRQIILFPIQAMSNVYQMYYAQAMNHYLYKQNDPAANQWAARVREAFRRDSLLCAGYNHEMSDGKWNGMMTQKHIGYKIWNDNFPCDKMPNVLTVADETPGGFTFSMGHDGFVAIEAEHYYEATDAADAQWTVIPDMGRTLSAITLMPYTVPTGDAFLSYRWTGENGADSVRVHIVLKSTLDYLNKGGLAYQIALDGQPAQTVVFNDLLNEKPKNIYSIFYPTVARRVIESVVTLPIRAQQQPHILTLHPCDPAIVFEKIVIDAGGYQPQYLFGKESRKMRQ